MSQPDGPAVIEGERYSPLAHRLLFVLLACLSFVLFAPAILLPVLREHCNLLAEEKRLTERIAELDREVKHREQLTDAFAHDAIVNERLALLDLHYRKPGEVVVAVLPGGGATAAPPPAEPPTKAPPVVLPDDWPDWAHRAQQWADERGLIGLFLDPTLRPVFFLMSAGLLIAAFVLFAPDVKQTPTTSHDPAPTLAAKDGTPS